MVSGWRSYLLPTLLAVLLHVVIVALTATTWFESDTQRMRVTPRHVKAELVDLRAQNQAQADKKREAEAKKKAAAQKKAQEKKRAEAKKRADDKKRAEAKRKADAKKKAEADKKAAAKKRAEAQKKAEQLKVAEREKAEQQRRAKAEADRLAAQRAEVERKAAEAERQRQAAEQAKREAEARAQAERAWVAKAEQLVASAESVIREGIQSHWRRPPSARNGMVVGVRIHLLPTGEVDDAYVTQSSGDEAFDRSAVNAVLKAERFPELQDIDPLVFDRYLRRITLKFRPEDLRR